MKKIIIIIGFLLLGTGLHAQITPLQEAVDFTVTDVQGNEINLFEILDGGQAVFIHFFLTYNFDPPIMPFMTEAYSLTGCNQHDVYFMEIAHREDNQECLQWIDRFQVEYPTISVEGGGLKVYDDYGITACPTLVLIMPDRSITIHGAMELYPFSTDDIIEALAQYGNIQQHDCDTPTWTLEEDNSPTLFPNPVNDFVVFDNQDLGLVSVYNVLGQKMEEFNTDERRIVIPTTHYPNGIYLLRTSFGKAHRFIVSH